MMQISRGVFVSMVVLVLCACGGKETPTEGTSTETSSVESPAGGTADDADSLVAATKEEAAEAVPAAFAQCKACHSTEPGKMMIGPSLAGIAGKQAGSVPGFTYSGAMKASGLTWDAATLDKYLADPKGVVPGTKMAFVGLKDEAKRKEVVDYLLTLD